MPGWYIVVALFGVENIYREAGGVGVFQEGLKNNSEVVPEEPVAVQQFLKSFLWMEDKSKSIPTHIKAVLKLDKQWMTCFEGAVCS